MRGISVKETPVGEVVMYGDRRVSVNVAWSIPLPKGTTKREPHWLRAEQLG